jgi:hypothetical protein
VVQNSGSIIVAMKTKVFLVLIVLAGLFIFSTNAQAEMQRVIFNAWTQDEPGPGKRLCVTVEIVDDEYTYPPDYIRTIKITAPDLTVFFLDLSKDWLPWDAIYYRAFLPSEFKGQVIPPKGTYTVKVTATDGTSLTQSDAVINSFLPIPTLTYPAPGETNVPENAVITWDPIVGATSYEIRLFNLSWGDWVYYYPWRSKYTQFTSHTFPKGILKPNCDYKIQILVRGGAAGSAQQDMDMRSRTGWIQFRTAAW